MPAVQVTCCWSCVQLVRSCPLMRPFCSFAANTTSADDAGCCPDGMGTQRRRSTGHGTCTRALQHSVGQSMRRQSSSTPFGCAAVPVSASAVGLRVAWHWGAGFVGRPDLFGRRMMALRILRDLYAVHAGCSAEGGTCATFMYAVCCARQLFVAWLREVSYDSCGCELLAYSRQSVASAM